MLGYDDPQQVLWSLEDMAGQLFVGGEAEMRIRALLRERGGLFGYETRLWRRDGSHIEVLMNLLLRHDEEELVEGFVADITERVQAQQRLQTMNEELERRVAERTHELEELNRQLRQARDAAEAANHSKDKYLAAASHDLLQPLNARGCWSTPCANGLPAAELQLVERTHLALEGAETLLTDLLEIARLDQSAIRPDLDDYSLDELLAPLASEFEEVARAAGLALRARIPRLAVRTDARLLSRILRNLLSNACRYTERGSVLLGRAGVAARYAWRCGTLAGASPPTSCRRSSSSSTNWTPGALPSAVASGSAGHRRPYRRHPRLPHRGAFDSRPRLAVRHRGAAGPQAGAASTRRGDCAGFGW